MSQGCMAVVVGRLVYEEAMDPLEAAEKADELLPRTLPLGDLDIEEVLESDYFFA